MYMYTNQVFGIFFIEKLGTITVHISIQLSLSPSLSLSLSPSLSLPLSLSLSLSLARMLVPQADGYSRESVHEFLTQVAQENLLQSWRETMLMVHKQPTKLPTQRQVTSVSKSICGIYI
jgi:hypothetical protein